MAGHVPGHDRSNYCEAPCRTGYPSPAQRAYLPNDMRTDRYAYRRPWRPIHRQTAILTVRTSDEPTDQSRRHTRYSPSDRYTKSLSRLLTATPTGRRIYRPLHPPTSTPIDRHTYRPVHLPRLYPPRDESTDRYTYRSNSLCIIRKYRHRT